MQYIRLLFFYSVIFQSVIFLSVTFQSIIFSPSFSSPVNSSPANSAIPTVCKGARFYSDAGKPARIVAVVEVRQHDDLGLRHC